MKQKTLLLNFLSIILIALVVQLSSCSSDDETPSETTAITSIDPETGTAGTLVTINGKGFGATEADNVVKFNGVEATIMAATPTLIVAVVPDAAGTGAVTVTVGTTVITGPTFTYTEPTPGATYYISFKANGVTKIFEEGNPGYQVCGDCSCSYMPVLNETRYAGLDICQPSSVTSDMIVALKNKTIPFKDGGTFPIASLGFEENDIYYHTDYVDQGTFSVNVTDVVTDGVFVGNNGYKVTGTFTCKVAKSDGSLVTNITEGKFVVRYTEDY